MATKSNALSKLASMRPSTANSRSHSAPTPAPAPLSPMVPAGATPAPKLSARLTPDELLRLEEIRAFLTTNRRKPNDTKIAFTALALAELNAEFLAKYDEIALRDGRRQTKLGV